MNKIMFIGTLAGIYLFSIHNIGYQSILNEDPLVDISAQSALLMQPKEIAQTEETAQSEIIAQNELEVIAGNGNNIAKDGVALKSSIGMPQGMLLRADGSLLILDSHNNMIRKLQDGNLTNFMGKNLGLSLYNYPIGGHIDGVFADAVFHNPVDITRYNNGYLVSDKENDSIRYIDIENGKVVTIIDNTGGLDGPTGLATGDNGEVYIADTYHNLIKVCDKEGNIKIFAGGEAGYQDGSLAEARFNQPTGLYYMNGILYVADCKNQRIRTIQNGTVKTLAGSSLVIDPIDGGYIGDYVDGTIIDAEFFNPMDIAVDENGTVYVADSTNACIRKIQAGMVTTILSAKENDFYPARPSALLLEKDILYISDSFANIVYKIKVQ